LLALYFSDATPKYFRTLRLCLEVGGLQTGEKAVVEIKEVSEMDFVQGKYFIYRFPLRGLVGNDKNWTPGRTGFLIFGSKRSSDLELKSYDVNVTIKLHNFENSTQMFLPGSNFDSSGLFQWSNKQYFDCELEQDITLILETVKKFKTFQILENDLISNGVNDNSSESDWGANSETGEVASCLSVNTKSLKLTDWYFDDPRNFFILVDLNVYSEFDQICNSILSRIVENLDEEDHKIQIVCLGGSPAEL